MPDDLWHQLDELAHDRPELWAKCYPKIYEGVDGGEHYSAKFVGYFLLTVAFKIEQPEVRMYKHFNETVEAIWASRLAAYRVPIFWLIREITEALKLTTLPVALDLTTMKLPFEAAVFMLPKGSLTYQSEATDVVCASYARAAMCEEIPSINPSAVETITGRGDFSVFAGMLNGLLLNWSHPWEQPLDIAQLDATIQDTPNDPLQTQFQTDITTYGKHFMARVAHLVFNTPATDACQTRVSFNGFIGQAGSQQTALHQGVLGPQHNRQGLQAEAGVAATWRDARDTAWLLGPRLLARSGVRAEL